MRQEPPSGCNYREAQAAGESQAACPGAAATRLALWSWIMRCGERVFAWFVYWKLESTCGMQRHLVAALLACLALRSGLHGMTKVPIAPVEPGIWQGTPPILNQWRGPHDPTPEAIMLLVQDKKVGPTAFHSIRQQWTKRVKTCTPQ
eukprot:2242543-Amphidinium_carterae.1